MTEQREQLVRTVKEVGNGAHVFAPKEWAGEKVLVIRIETKPIKEQLLEILSPHLDKIIAVFFYGSYARKEETENSDIDVLIIAKEKFKIEKGERFEFIVLPESNINSAIKQNPILMYSFIREAKPIINSEYIKNFIKYRLNKKLFLPFIDSTFKAIESNKEILELDKKTGKTASNSLIYSIILRLKGIFIIRKLIKNEAYFNSLFRRWILDNCKVNYEKIYNAYRIIRDSKEDKESRKEEVKLAEAELLLNFLEREIQKLKIELK